MKKQLTLKTKTVSKLTQNANGSNSQKITPTIFTFTTIFK